MHRRRRVLLLESQAWEGHISREDFALSCAHQEFNSFRQTRDFLRKYPLVDTGDSARNPHYDAMFSVSDDFGQMLKWKMESHRPIINILEYQRDHYDQLMAARRSRQLSVDSGQPK
jgi:hypothetical protein